MHLIMAGINHETAPVEYREKLAFNETECEDALETLKKRACFTECMILSTCNRTEIYVRTAPDADGNRDDIADSLIVFLTEYKQVETINRDIFYLRYDEYAARHLFRISAGLESMIKGEAQILAQVRQAYSVACRVRSCDFFLHKLLHAAFRAGKRARSETDIGVGAVSVSLAAVELAERIYRDLSEKKALVIGAGEMAHLTAEHFMSKGVSSLAVANRTLEKAQELAGELGARAVPFNNLIEEIAAADVVITSTAAPHFIIDTDSMKGAMKLRRNRQIFLIDIAVPRNIDPQVKRLYNVFAHDIDDLNQIVDRNLERRRAEIPRVERIVQQELDSFKQWHDSLGVTPTIKDLVGAVDEIRREEIKKSAKYFDEEQLEHIDAMTRSIVKKILHHPITKLRETKNGQSDGSFWADTVRNIFNLRNANDE